MKVAQNEDGEITPKYKCDICDKKYNSNNSLWYHKKKCTAKKTVESDELTIDKSMIMSLIKDNQEFKRLLLEQIKERK